MLRTALKPRWIGFFLFTLAVSLVFVGLSKWQIDQSIAGGAPPRSQTETPVEFTEHIKPGEPLMMTQSDQMVYLTGSIDVDSTVQIAERKRGDDIGYWLASAVDLHNNDPEEDIVVVWGWVAEPLEANTEQLTEIFEDSLGTSADTEMTFTGRLIPGEGAQPGTKFGAEPIIVPTLSTGELVNLWDRPLYTAAVVVEEFDVAGTIHTIDGEAGHNIQPVSVAPQPLETQVVWLNIFYAIEWVIFAAFSFYLWWRFVRDDYLKEQREAELDALWAQHWKAQELQRRRHEAARAKAEAEAAYRAYYDQDPESKDHS